MAKGKKSSKSDQEQAKRYVGENRFEKNKLRRLARHCKQHPEDVAAQKVLDKANFKYVRNSFKGNKAQPKPIKLKDMSLDTRMSMREQLIELINNGELVVYRR